MARRWVVLAMILLGCGVAEAKYEAPPPFGPECSCLPPPAVPSALHEGGLTPGKPSFADAEVYVDSTRVVRIDITGARFSGDTQYVRIELRAGDKTTTADTTPEHMILCEPSLWTAENDNIVHVRLGAIDGAGNLRWSDPHGVLTANYHGSSDRPCGGGPHYNCGLGATIGALFAIVLALLLGICAIAVLIARAVGRPRGAPEEVPLLVAEHVARIVLVQQVRLIVVGVAGIVGAFATHLLIFASVPILFMGFGVIDAMVARSALRRLERPGADADLYDNVLLVRDERGVSQLRPSRRTVRRARARGVAAARVNKT